MEDGGETGRRSGDNQELGSRATSAQREELEFDRGSSSKSVAERRFPDNPDLKCLLGRASNRDHHEPRLHSEISNFSLQKSVNSHKPRTDPENWRQLTELFAALALQIPSYAERIEEIGAEKGTFGPKRLRSPTPISVCDVMRPLLW